MPFVSRPITTYGLNEDAQVRAYEVQPEGTRMRFNVQRTHRETLLPPLQVELNLPGLHNVRNALAAIAVATELGVSDEAICDALSAFKGVGRRFTQTGEFPVPANHGGGTFPVIDDYGHHPVEMAATLAAARGAWPDRRIVLAFRTGAGHGRRRAADRGLCRRRTAPGGGRRPRPVACLARGRQGRTGLRRRRG
ncbi:hypothetical protein G6F57_019443 [Rhizopus arrhizus]|nr:hypothetical protein G6F57_019443 [Rhizopus arrhizus]